MDNLGQDSKFKRRRGFILNSSRLVALFQSRGWSQQEFALQAGLDARTIAKVRRGGACDASTLQILAATLKVAPSELIDSIENSAGIGAKPEAVKPEIVNESESPSLPWKDSVRILDSWKVIDLRQTFAPSSETYGMVWERFRFQKMSEDCEPITFPYLTWGKGIENTSPLENCKWRKVAPAPGDLLHSDKCWELIIQTPQGPADTVFESGPHGLKFIDAFHGPGQQWWQTRVAYVVRSMIIQILFPADAPCKELSASWAAPGQNRFAPVLDDKPFVLNDGSMASWHLFRPAMGSFLKIEWKW